MWPRNTDSISKYSNKHIRIFNRIRCFGLFWFNWVRFPWHLAPGTIPAIIPAVCPSISFGTGGRQHMWSDWVWRWLLGVLSEWLRGHGASISLRVGWWICSAAERRGRHQLCNRHSDGHHHCSKAFGVAGSMSSHFSDTGWTRGSTVSAWLHWQTAWWGLHCTLWLWIWHARVRPCGLYVPEQCPGGSRFAHMHGEDMQLCLANWTWGFPRLYFKNNGANLRSFLWSSRIHLRIKQQPAAVHVFGLWYFWRCSPNLQTHFMYGFGCGQQVFPQLQRKAFRRNLQNQLRYWLSQIGLGITADMLIRWDLHRITAQLCWESLAPILLFPTGAWTQISAMGLPLDKPARSVARLASLRIPRPWYVMPQAFWLEPYPHAHHWLAKQARSFRMHLLGIPAIRSVSTEAVL